jgi:hypothetical protein
MASLHKALERAKSINVLMPLDAWRSKPQNLRNIGSLLIQSHMEKELEAMIASEKDGYVRAYLCLGATEGFEPENVEPIAAAAR